LLRKHLLLFDADQVLRDVDSGAMEKLMNQSATEKIAALDNLERNLISFERNGLKFNNTLPAVGDQQGRGKLVVISGLLGGVFGFLWYVLQTVMASYRRRYLK